MFCTFIVRISNGNSVLVSVTSRYRSKPRWDRVYWFSPYDSFGSSVLWQNFTLLGSGGLHKRGDERGAPTLKRRYFAAIGSSAVKIVANRHRHAAYYNKHWWWAS